MVNKMKKYIDAINISYQYMIILHLSKDVYGNAKDVYGNAKDVFGHTKYVFSYAKYV
jgi:hypothetical protein